ncbi:MAG: Asp-tRNA(Asn)/Glu-tRNA(Gln) amidotransferase subunit GatC [Gammaproteobacteria bacterium]|nr:Asp-tRNA(Asn)/Glu-tRNA(Gln) amidotransferase subunit GatC [Gammaproteobacteria bacterium]
MPLERADIENIAHLARLELDEADVATYARHLSDILAFVEQLDAADTEGVTPMAHPLDAVQRLRPDEVTEPDQRDRFQAIAPAVEDGLYLVPRVIE